MPAVLALAPPPLMDQSAIGVDGVLPIPMRMWWLENQINPVPLDGHADVANGAGTSALSLALPLAGHGDVANGAGTSTLNALRNIDGHADVAASAGTSVLSALRNISGHADASNGAGTSTLNATRGLDGHADVANWATGDAKVAWKIVGHADVASGGSGVLTVSGGPVTHEPAVGIYAAGIVTARQYTGGWGARINV